MLLRQDSPEETPLQASPPAAAADAEATPAMHWRMVERLVGDAFRRRGYVVTGFGGARAMGVTADIGLLRNGERFLVQCQHWHKLRVGVLELIDLSRIVAAQGARGGFAVTTGRFTSEAWDFARRTPLLVLYDERSLPWLLCS
jgi:restriction system protein